MTAEEKKLKSLKDAADERDAKRAKETQAQLKADFYRRRAAA